MTSWVTSFYKLVFFSAFSPPQPSCVPIQSSDSVCSQFVSWGTMVYVPGETNITALEELAQAAVKQLVNDSTYCYNQMVKFICNSYLAPCHANQAMPRSLCPQSCNALKERCNRQTFGRVQEQLPSWSTARNCSSLRQTEAGSVAECIHLSAPLVEQENYTDGE